MVIDTNDEKHYRRLRVRYPAFFTREDVISDYRDSLRIKGYVSLRNHPNIFHLAPIRKVKDIYKELEKSSTIPELENVAKLWADKQCIPSWSKMYDKPIDTFILDFEKKFLEKEIRTRRFHPEIRSCKCLTVENLVKDSWLDTRRDVYNKYKLVTNWPEVFLNVVRDVPEERFKKNSSECRRFTWEIVKNSLITEMDYDYYIYSRLDCVVTPMKNVKTIGKYVDLLLLSREEQETKVELFRNSTLRQISVLKSLII